MHVRKTTNLEMIARLDKKIFEGDREDKIKGGDYNLWWLAYVDGKIAGFAGLKVYPGDRSGFLTRAGVLKEYRGQGLQKALIKARDNEARRLGLECNITYTADWNCASANNLIACGYKLYVPQHAYGIKHAMYFWKHFKYRS
jgi:GNAT superfamily N-acetyltransferase